MVLSLATVTVNMSIDVNAKNLLGLVGLTKTKIRKIRLGKRAVTLPKHSPGTQEKIEALFYLHIIRDDELSTKGATKRQKPY